MGFSLPIGKRAVASLAAAALIAAAAWSTLFAQSPIESIPVAHGAQVDYFLKIDGIDGESADDRHKNEIDILSFSWGANEPGINARGPLGGLRTGGGGGAGKATFQDFHFVKEVDKASPKLMLSTATGQHYPKATLSVRKAGGGQQEFMMITLTDVLVTSYQTGGSQGSVPTDQFSLNYSKIEFEYSPQRPDGSLDAPVKAGYDVKANKKI